MIQIRNLCTILVFSLIFGQTKTFSQPPLQVKPDSSSSSQGQPKFEDEMYPIPLNLDSIINCIGYPREAKKKKIQGVVKIEVHFTGEGKYIDHLVLSDPHPVLTAAVERHIRYIRSSSVNSEKFSVPEFWITLPFRFTLKK